MSSEGNGITKCYAIRCVNPFLGVMQIIETEDGRSSSTNGLSWVIEVSELIDINTADSLTVEKIYHHGLCSEEQGLINRLFNNRQ